MIRRMLAKSDRNRSEPATYPQAWEDTYKAPSFLPTTHVSEEKALGVAAAWRAVNMIANDIATMPLQAFDADSKVDAPRLLTRPNAAQTRSDTISQLVYSLVVRGNAYALLGDFDDELRPQQIEVVHPDLVDVSRVEGRIIYHFGGNNYRPGQILHIRGLTAPGALVGLSPLTVHRQNFGSMVAQSEYGWRQWNESAVPSTALKIDDPDLTAEDARAISDDWHYAHARSRRPAVISSNITVETLSFSPEDAQFLESREFSILEVANIFGVPPFRLGAPAGGGTYQNAQQDDLRYLKHSLNPWIIRIEQAFNDLLPEGVECRFNPDALLRADTAGRYAAHETALRAGFLTVDEVRELENRDPLPDNEVNDEVDAA